MAAPAFKDIPRRFDVAQLVWALEQFGEGASITDREKAQAVARAVQMTVGGVAGWYRENLDGSFSSVSRPIFASK